LRSQKRNKDATSGYLLIHQFGQLIDASLAGGIKRAAWIEPDRPQTGALGTLHIVDERIADKKDLLGRQPDSSANRGEKLRRRLAPTDLRADDDVLDRTQLRFAGNHTVK